MKRNCARTIDDLLHDAYVLDDVDVAWQSDLDNKPLVDIKAEYSVLYNSVDLLSFATVSF